MFLKNVSKYVSTYYRISCLLERCFIFNTETAFLLKNWVEILIYDD